MLRSTTAQHPVAGEGAVGRYAKKGDHALREDEITIGESGLPVLKHALAFFEWPWTRATTAVTTLPGRPGDAHVGEYGGRPLVFYEGGGT